MRHNVDQFVDEFLATTWQNPFVDNDRVFFDRVFFQVAAVSLKIVDEDEIVICRICSLERGKGYGSLALDWLVHLADKHGVKLKGTIEPCGKEPRLTVRQLQAWYKRHGFSIRGREISREPISELAYGHKLEPSIDWNDVPF